ncbi:hypothetical protein Tco_0233566 [Tanacetum coccineum]
MLGAPGRLYILVDFFFNKDLEYLRIENSEEKKYATSFTKPKATRYELYRIEEMIPNMWSPSKVSYDKDAAYGITNQKEYLLKEANFPRLHLNDIEDIIVLKHRVEDVQLGVESYQTKLEFTMPQNNKKCLMREDDVYKFGDATIMRLNNFWLGYNEDMLTRPWSDKDPRWIESMLKVLEKTLRRRRIIRSLECFMGGRKLKTAYRLLTWTD